MSLSGISCLFQKKKKIQNTSHAVIQISVKRTLVPVKGGTGDVEPCILATGV
jgi:hypothetical protein